LTRALLSGFSFFHNSNFLEKNLSQIDHGDCGHGTAILEGVNMRFFLEQWRRVLTPAASKGSIE
jgi:hypothetical protein